MRACRPYAAYLSQISERAHGGRIHGLGEVLLHEAQQLLLQLLHLPGMPRLSLAVRDCLAACTACRVYPCRCSCSLSASESLAACHTNHLE